MHCTNANTLTMVPFSLKVTLGSYEREIICSSVRERRKVVPNAHLHLASARRRAERLHEACWHSAKKSGTQYTAIVMLLFP